MNDSNFFYTLSCDKQMSIKKAYAAFRLKADKENISVFENFYGKETLEHNNPYMKFVA